MTQDNQETSDKADSVQERPGRDKIAIALDTLHETPSAAISATSDTPTIGDATTGQPGEVPISPTTPAISPEEQLRRQAQSLADKEVAKQMSLMRQQQQQFANVEAQRQEQLRTAEMDDEEYGQYARVQQEANAARLVGYQQALNTTFEAAKQQVLKTIPDKTAREALEARAGEFKTYAEFVDEAFSIKTGLIEAKLRTKLTAEITTSLANQGAAARAGRGPALGSGLSTLTTDFRSLSPQAKILAGLEENAKKTK